MFIDAIEVRVKFIRGENKSYKTSLKLSQNQLILEKKLS